MGVKHHERHVKNCDARANLPNFEIRAAEPILLHRPRFDDKQPKAQLCRTSPRRQYREKRLIGARRDFALTFKVGNPTGTDG